MTMVDTNVIIDVREGGAWQDWSLKAIAEARASGRVMVSSIVIGELANRNGALEDLTAMLNQLGLAVESLTSVGAFRAGRAQRAYREAGGGRERLLGDFLIGGHAVAFGTTLITRDARRYRRYFPDLPLITPETDHG